MSHGRLLGTLRVVFTGERQRKELVVTVCYFAIGLLLSGLVAGLVGVWHNSRDAGHAHQDKR